MCDQEQAVNAYPFPFLRVWGSVMHDGQPRAEVRDAAVGMPRPSLEDNFRPWRWAVVDDNSRDEESTCAGPLGCYPGHPCPGCQQTAVRWWYEWERRDAVRKWRATHEEDRPQTSWKRSDWCPHGKGHSSEEAARKCAKKHGFPRVVEMNGHGHRVRWVDVHSEKGR